MDCCKIRSYNYKKAQIFGKKPTWINRLIAIRSSPQVHTEFQFSSLYNHISFSNTMQDDVKCARFKQIGYSHGSERWDTINVLMTREEEDMAYLEAKRLEGTPYALISQLCHISKWKIWKPSKKKDWCTRTVANVVSAGCVGFGTWLECFSFSNEIRPDQFHVVAGVYFAKRQGSAS